MKRYLITLLIVPFVITSLLYAQNEELALVIFGSTSLPTGDFGKDIGKFPKMTRRAGFDVGDKEGLAQTGFGVGAEIITPVKFKSLSWILSGKFLYNGVDGSAVQSEFRHQLGDTVDINFDFGNWINIPVMTGFKYDFRLSHKLVLYGMLQGGINVSKAASLKATVAGITVEKTTFDFARDFGYEVGLGLLFDHRYNIGFRYLALSTPRYEGTRKLSEIQFTEIYSRKTAILGEERSISMFVVTLGVQLFK